MSACYRQDYEMAELLLHHCASPNQLITSKASYIGYGSSESNSPLAVASELQDKRLISMLLSKCDVPPPDALLIVINSESHI